MLIYLATYSDTALLVLRLALGALLVVHGWPKIKDLRKNAENFDHMGFKPGAFFGSIAAFLEFFGGIALIVGFMTQLVAALFAAQFLVILAWRLSKKHAFVGGWELDLVMFGALILLLSIGGGNFSADAFFLLSGF